MVPYGTIWYHTVPYGAIWYLMVPYGTLWYHKGTIRYLMLAYVRTMNICSYYEHMFEGHPSFFPFCSICRFFNFPLLSCCHWLMFPFSYFVPLFSQFPIFCKCFQVCYNKKLPINHLCWLLVICWHQKKITLLIENTLQ